MGYTIGGSVLGFCRWDLPAFLVLLAVIIVFVVKIRRMKKQEKELEAELSDSPADEISDVKS